jgi:signal transduction histidine kinase
MEPLSGQPTPSAASVSPAPGRSSTEEGLSLRVLLFLGFTGVFLLWLASAFALVQRMADADRRGAELRQRFLENDRALSTISTKTLQSWMSVRDALLDPRSAASAKPGVLADRDEVEQALDAYELRETSEEEGRAWFELERELEAYWAAVIPIFAAPRRASAPESPSAVLNTQIVPKRLTIVRILDQIHLLNDLAFNGEQTELSDVRADLRAQVWRTSAIAGLFGVLIAVLATRFAGRLEGRIREHHAQAIQQRAELERLSKKLLVAQEDERRRIARELHDEVGQAIGAIKLELAVAARRLSSGGDELAEARAMADGALESVRELSRLLHPSILDDLGLPDSTASYLQHFTRRTGIRTELHVDRLSGRLDSDLEVCAYRVIQEAVTNVGRHAAASNCTVRLERRDDSLLVAVEDDGTGFTPGTLPSAQHFGLGLISLRERVAGRGGTLEVTSGAGRGTRVTADLPLVLAS